MKKLETILFPIYLGAVILAGATAILVAALGLRTGVVTGPRPIAFFVFAICLVFAELRPLNWLSLQDGGEVTASFTFGLALLFIAPAFAPVVFLAGTCFFADVLGRKPLIRAAFNGAQVGLSLAFADLAFNLISGREQLTATGWAGFRWLLATLAAAGVAFLLNGLLTCIALALHQKLPVVPMIRRSIGVNLAMDGLLLALAPVFAIVAVHNVVVIPLLLVTVWVIYHSAVLALQNRHEATHDLLTGLPNRRHFEEQAKLSLAGASRTGERLAVVQLDLNGFKGINDQLGHHYGDLVLKHVAERLNQTKRPTDLLARLGGDEFAILLRRVTDERGVESAGARFLESLEPSMLLDGLPMTIGGSFGVALYPDHGEDLTTLLHNADMAMYEAKVGGLGVHLYEPGGKEFAPARHSLLADLRAALDRQELFLLYQPRVEVQTGQLQGVEALIRWDHPRLGLVEPSQFMPMAEHSEIIDELTGYICRLAIEQCRQWYGAGLPVGVAINISARNLHDLRFPATLAGWIEAAGLPAHLIEVEVTENTMMADALRSAAVLKRLREFGISVSIDDFGTGHSSLSVLRNESVNWVKIDRSFVTGMAGCAEDAMIVRSIVELAHNLGLRTVAEGVECLDEMAMLQVMGCDLAQGYLFARPSSPSQLEPLLRRGVIDVRAQLAVAATAIGSPR